MILRLQEEYEKKAVESEKRERPELEAVEKPVKEKPAPVPEEPEDAEKYKKMPKVEAEVTDEESKLAIGKAKVRIVYPHTVSKAILDSCIGLPYAITCLALLSLKELIGRIDALLKRSCPMDLFLMKDPEIR